MAHPCNGILINNNNNNNKVTTDTYNKMDFKNIMLNEGIQKEKNTYCKT